MSAVSLYPEPQPSFQVSLTLSIKRLAKVNDVCDAVATKSVVYIITSSRLYCLSCEPMAVLWTCALPSASCKKVWSINDQVWVADADRVLMCLDVHSQIVLPFNCESRVLALFEYSQILTLILDTGSIQIYTGTEWTPDTSLGMWQRKATESAVAGTLLEVFQIETDLVVVTSSEITVFGSRDRPVSYSPDGKIQHVYMRPDQKLRFGVLVQGEENQLICEVQVTNESFQTISRMELTVINLLKILSQDYVLEYSNASLCISELSQNEAISKLKQLIATESFREAEPVLRALGDSAIPLIREVLKECTAVSNVSPILRLIRVLPQPTVISLCQDLQEHLPDNLDLCSLLLSKALELMRNFRSSAELMTIRKEMTTRIRKVETYKILKDSLDMSLLQFFDTSVELVVRDLFSRGRLHQAIVLLNRHSMDEIQLTENPVQLLDDLPDLFDVKLLLDWLQYELIPVLSIANLQALETWIEHRVRVFADSNIDLAYDLAMAIPRSPGFSYLSQTGNEASVLTGVRSRTIANQYHQKVGLIELQNSLKALRDLRDLYHMEIRFSEFQRLSSEEIADLMLLRISDSATVHQEVSTQFKPYVEAQGWKCDTILLNFFLRKRSETMSETVLFALVQEIKDKEDRVKAAECLLEQASHPLSAEMKDLLHLCDPTGTNDALSTQVLFADMHELGRQMGLPTLYTTDQHQMLQLIEYLALQEGETHMRMAVQLAETLNLRTRQQVYQDKVMHLVKVRKASEINGLLNNAEMSIEEKRQLLEDGCMYCLLLLNLRAHIPPHLRELSEWQKDQYDTGLLGLEHLNQIPDRYLAVRRAVPHLRKLSRDYKLFLSYEEWSSRSVASEVITRIAAVQKDLEPITAKRKRIDTLPAPEKRTKVSSSRIYYLGGLLGLPREQVKLQTSGSDLVQLRKVRCDAYAGLDANWWDTAIPQLFRLVENDPSAEAIGALSSHCQAYLYSCPGKRLRDALNLESFLSAVQSFGHMTGTGGKYPNEQANEYFKAFHRYQFNEENLSIDRETFSHFVHHAALAQVREMIDLAVSFNVVFPVLPLIRMNTTLAETVKVTESVVWSCLRAWTIDHSLALGLLLTLPTSSAFKLLEDASQLAVNSLEIKKDIFALGVDVSIFFRNSEQKQIWKTRESNISWQHNFSSLGITYPSDTFTQNQDPNKMMELVPRLMKKSEDLELAVEFCRSYAIPETEAIIAYIENLLLNPKVKSEIVPHLSDPPATLSTLLTSSPFDNEYQSLIRGVIPDIQKESLVPMLRKSLEMIPQTDYERVRFVFSLLLDTGVVLLYKRQKQTIEMLMDFRRVSTPTPAELSLLQEDQAHLPKELSNLREALLMVKIPLDSILVNPTEAISRELRIQTLDALLPVAVFNRLDPDSMRILAVTNELLAHQHNPGERCVDCPSFSMVKPIISKVRSYSEKFELMQKVVRFFGVSTVGRVTDDYVAATNFKKVTTGLWLESLGPDADKDLYEKVQNHVKDSGKSAKKAVLEFELSQYSLHSQFAHLTETPVDLISKVLYDLIPELPTSSLISEDELWTLVLALGKRSEVSIDQLLESLIQTWISVKSPVSPHPKDDRAFTLKLSDSEAAETEARLTFLAKHWDVLAVVTALYDFLDETKRPEASLRSRVQALGILLKICPEAEIRKMIPSDRLHGTDISLYFQHCCYQVDLEEMRIPYSMEMLLTCDKLLLVRTLVRSHGNERRTVQLAAGLIIDFRLTDSELISQVIDLMVVAEDFQVLCFFLHELTIHTSLPSELTNLVMKTLGKSLIHLKTSNFQSEFQHFSFLSQLRNIVTIVENIDPESQDLVDLVELLMDGFFQMETMESVITAAVRLCLVVRSGSLQETLATQLAERYAASHPLEIAIAIKMYVPESQPAHPLLRVIYLKIEEEGNYQPLLTNPPIFQHICSFLLSVGRCKRLFKLVKRKLGRQALSDISNQAAPEDVIKEVTKRLQNCL